MLTHTNIMEARSLYQAGHQEQAEDILLRIGYEDGLDPQAQHEYDVLFPQSAAVQEKLAPLALQLSSPSRAERIEAAKYIERQARKSWNIQIKTWLRNPHTTALLISKLTEPDEEFRDEIIGALYFIAMRYFRDRRALPYILPILKNSQQLTHHSAARLIYILSGSEYLDKILDAILPSIDVTKTKNRSPTRRSAIDIISQVFATPVTQAHRSRIYDAVVLLTNDKDTQVRDITARILGHQYPQQSYRLLVDWAKTERASTVRQSLKEVISDIKTKRYPDETAPQLSNVNDPVTGLEPMLPRKSPKRKK